MIKKFSLLIFCLYATITKADMPGKKSMSDSKVIIQKINKLTAYDFYWRIEDDSAKLIKGDTTLSIPSSAGAPYNAIFWGVNRETQKSTDTLSFENYYAPDYTVSIDTIENNKFRYTQKKILNNNAGGVTGDNDVNDEKTNSSRIIMFGAISLIALILLIWIFIRRKSTSRNV